MSLLIITLFTIFTSNCLAVLPYCQPSDTKCWPSTDEINTFSQQLDGSLVLKDMTNSLYINLTTQVQNPWYISYPAFIILIKSHSDVQNCVKFASLHNIQISIQSTGHSFSGRNSANNSLQMNLGSMQSYTFNKETNPPTITVETGVRWGTIYKLINDTLPEYVIVGGGDPGVGPAGYSSLGGHSPLTPKYGLSSDYIREFSIVVADSRIIRVFNTNGKNETIDDLLWSLRGGGASTFGVILNITFELIKMEIDTDHKMNIMECNYPIYAKPILKQQYIGYDLLYSYFEYIQNDGLDPSVSGYFNMVFDTDYNYNNYIIQLVFIYFGNTSFAKQMFQPLMTLNPYNKNETAYCILQQVSYFYDFWQYTPADSGGISPLYIYNDFIPKANLTTQYADNLLTILNETDLVNNGYGFYTSCATMIGGYNNLENFPYGVDSSVGAGIRSGYYSHSMDIFWNENDANMDDILSYSKKWEETFRPFGNGIYSNEENYECDDCDWKEQFWQKSNYDRLLKVKQKIDPNQVFWCNHCVGSDI